MAFKSVKQRLKEWLPQNMPDANFNGTEAGFQQYRQQWVNNCASSVSTGLLQSKKNALGQCQTAFDTETGGYQMEMYTQDAVNLQTVKENNEKLQQTAVFALFIIAVIGLIVWLLTSK